MILIPSKSVEGSGQVVHLQFLMCVWLIENFVFFSWILSKSFRWKRKNVSWWCAWWCPRVARRISAQAAIGWTATFVCQDKQGTGHEQGQEDGQSALGRHLWTGAGTTVSTTTTSLHTPMEEIQLKTHLIWISPPLSLRRCAQQVFETQHQFLLASSQDGWSSWNTWIVMHSLYSA